MPNVMVALPNIGGALYSTPQSLADAHYYMPCSNAAKTRNQLKFCGVPQTNETIAAASGSKFTILWEKLEDILLLNKFFFPIVDTWRLFSILYFQRAACSTFQTCILNLHWATPLSEEKKKKERKKKEETTG